MSRRLGAWTALLLGCVLIGGCNNEKTTVQGGTSKTVAASVKSKGPAPLFVAKERSHRFGTMDQQQTATHVFEIRNEGEGELVLRVTASSCGCTVVRLRDLVWDKAQQTNAPTTSVAVAPGDVIDLEMTWNTQLKSGQFTTVTTIVTNDPKQARAEFTVDGLIVPSVELSQNSVRFDDARNNQVTTDSVFIYSKKLDDVAITDVQSSNPLITAEFEPAPEEYLNAISAKCGLKANIKVNPGLPIGPFNAVLTLKPKCEGCPDLSISVGGQVGGDVRITPNDRFIFGTVKATESTTQRMFLKFLSESDSPVEVKEPNVKLRRLDLTQNVEVEKDAPVVTRGIDEENFLKVTLEKIETGKNRFLLKVEVPQGSPGGQFRGLIELETDHPTAKLVKIPVSVQVTK